MLDFHLVSFPFVSVSRGGGNILVHRPGSRILVPFRPSSVIYCVETIGRSAELNSLQPVVHHFVESARPAWQDPVYVSKLVDIVYIRVNWPVILSVEWSAISRPFLVILASRSACQLSVEWSADLRRHLYFCTRVNWPVILSVEWSAIFSRHDLPVNSR